MKNFRQEGDTIYVAAGGTITSGQGVVLASNVFGVAMADAASGEVYALRLKGVFNLPKKAEQWAQGEDIYWDAGEGKATNVSGSSNPLIGIAVNAPPYTTPAGPSDAYGDVRLNGSF